MFKETEEGEDWKKRGIENDTRYVGVLNEEDVGNRVKW